MDLAILRTLLIDGDGVLWRGDRALPGLHHFFDALHSRAIQWALLTNNNTRTVAQYLDKLARLGIDASASQIFSSSTVTAGYLIKKYGPGTPIHAVGMSGVIETLQDAGFQVSTGELMPTHAVAAVVAGMDRDFTYAKAEVATRLILGGAEFVATNTDGTYPTPGGLSPGTGWVIGALQGATGITPTVIGKPQRAIFEAALEGLHADRATTAMIGDRLDTDILGAQRVGIATIGVLTGVTTPEQMAKSAIQPDVIVEGIAALAEQLAQYASPAATTG
ncbi:MAG: HAD-IIA family hydrolase [Chloroflexota bacterium]|jgi:4-nitrophenyl phosphatase